MLEVSYDQKADALYIRLRHAKVDESDELSSGIIMDYDQKGRPVGIEVLGASKVIGGHPHLQIDLSPPELAKR